MSTKTGRTSTVLVTTDFRFSATADGKVWTTISNDASFWRQHYAYYLSVTIAARVRRVASLPSNASEVTGSGVLFCPLPDYSSPWGFLKAAPRILLRLLRVLRGKPVPLATLPGTVGFLLVTACVATGRPYAAQVVAEPADIFGGAHIGGRLRHLYRLVFTTALRWCCAHAKGVSYVTSNRLQERYPPAPDAVVGEYSLITLRPLNPSDRIRPDDATRLVTVGSLEQPYKGVVDLLHAMQLLKCQYSVDLSLRVVGGGRYQGSLEHLTELLSLDDQVTFTGWLQRYEVDQELAKADIFVLASHTEGMPRALIEAMWAGLPCVATNVGGIPELLPPEVLAPPRDPQQLALKIHQLLFDRDMRLRLAGENVLRAEEYSPENQRLRRTTFHRDLNIDMQLELPR